MKGQNNGGEPALATTTDPMREMASALVDGESSEFETRRVLEALDDPALRALVARHYTLRSVVRREAPMLCPPALTDSILAAIRAEQGAPAGLAPARWKNWVGGAAVAASVCFVTVVGVRGLPDAGNEAPDPAVAASGVTMGSLGAPVSPSPVLARSGAVPVGLGAAIPASADDADRAAERRLQMYMLEHARNASLNTPQGMIPYVRVDAREQP